MELGHGYEQDKSTGMIASMNEQEENNIETIGSYLKKARLEKSLSLDAISRHTKISNTNLEALEANNKKALPNIAYVKGFVKAYSKIIDADVTYTLSLLENLYRTKANSKPSSLVVSVSQNDHKIAASKTTVAKKSSEFQISKDLRVKLFGATAAIAIIGLIFFSRESREVVDMDSEITTESVTANSPLTAESTPISQDLLTEDTLDTIEEATEVVIADATKTADVKIELKPEVVKELSIKKVIVPAKVEAIKSEPVKVEKKVEEEKKENTTDVSFYNFSFPIYKIIEDSPEAKTHIPASQMSVNEAGQQNVFITATDGDTWITYKKDEEPVKKFVLKQGRYLTIRGEEVRLFLGNANATKIFLNNKLVDIDTTSGVKSLVFPETKARDLKLPLFIFNKDGSVTPSDEIKTN